jgi:hypothetical protein
VSDNFQPTSLPPVVSPKTTDLERSLGRLNSLARLMDDQFEVPGLKVRIGLDALIGAIPGGGDWITWLVSVYILWESMRLGVPIPVLLKMAGNLTLDVLVGYVPVVGDLADVAIKANRRNVNLALDHFGATAKPSAPEIIVIPSGQLQKPKPSPWLAAGLVLVLTAVLFALAAIPTALIYWLFFTHN